jgi:dihydrofolate synthase/folylpolyglutamate synthase
MNIDVTFEHTRFDYKEFKGVTSKLLGYHQCENASLALETVKILRDYYHYQISLDNIYDGIYHTFWPGRLQIIHKDPIIIVDGAHNIDGITRLTEFLRFVKKDKYLKIIFAVSADKAKEEMIPVIESVADEIIFSKFNYKRSDKADNLIELSHHLNKRVEEDLDKIIREVKTEKDKLIVFCGSLYFVSEVFKKF